MDFENNPINKAAWKHINKAVDRIKDNGKPFITFDVPITDILYPHTVNDNELMSKILKVDEDKRAEFLNELVSHLSTKEKIQLLKTIVETISIEEFTFFDKASIFNLIKPN